MGRKKGGGGGGGARKALLESVEYGEVDAVEEMLRECGEEALADLQRCADRQGKTAVALAALQGELEMVRVLVKAGFDVQAGDKRGVTPLHEAAAGDDGGVVHELLKAGADVGARDNEGNQPLHTASAECVGQLLKAGADANASNAAGTTPLMALVHKRERNACKLVIAAAKETVKAVSNEGWTALDFAVSVTDTELVGDLLEAGADPRHADATGRTAVHRAALENSAPCLEALLAAGAEVVCADDDGVTPLHLAAVHGHHGLVAPLSAAHAAKDSTGLTPLDWALGILPASMPIPARELYGNQDKAARALLFSGAALSAVASHKGFTGEAIAEGGAAMAALRDQLAVAPPTEVDVARQKMQKKVAAASEKKSKPTTKSNEYLKAALFGVLGAVMLVMALVLGDVSTA